MYVPKGTYISHLCIRRLTGIFCAVKSPGGSLHYERYISPKGGVGQRGFTQRGSQDKGGLRTKGVSFFFPSKMDGDLNRADSAAQMLRNALQCHCGHHPMAAWHAHARLFGGDFSEDLILALFGANAMREGADPRGMRDRAKAGGPMRLGSAEPPRVVGR